MESFNNLPSHLRTQSHGVKNFEYFRNRILFSNRKDAAIKLVPLSKEAVHTTGKKRGKYNK